MPVCSIDSDKERERERARENIKHPKVSQELPSQTNSSGQKNWRIYVLKLPAPLAIWVAQLDWFIIFFALHFIKCFRRYLCLSGAFSWLELLVWTWVRLNSKNSWCESCILGCWANSLNAILPSLRRWIVAGYFMLLHAFAIEFHF